MQKIGKNEEAVSPVIGVILMVAITVILAAVIAAFVFGMAGGVGKSKNIAATAQMIGTTITVTYQGGPDANSLAPAAVAGVNPLTTSLNGVALTTGDFPVPATVGSTATVAHSAAVKDHIVVVALFTDGTTQVILDMQI